MITSIILSYAWYFVIPILLIGAVLSYIYVPIVGHIGAIALVACAAALGSYELGYADRGKLDKSAELQQEIAQQQAVIDQQKKDAENNAKIASDVADRQKKAEALATDLQGQVETYEKQLKDADDATDDASDKTKTETVVVHDSTGKECPPPVRQKNVCALSPADVSGLRAIRRNRPTVGVTPPPAAAR